MEDFFFVDEGEKKYCRVVSRFWYLVGRVWRRVRRIEFIDCMVGRDYCVIKFYFF